MKRFILSFVLTFAVGLVLAASAAHAGPLTNAINNLDASVGPNTATGLSGNLTGTVGAIVKGVLALVGTIFFVLTIYAGIMWMTAMGGAEQIEKSRSILTAAVIGLAITLSAYAITFFIGTRLNSATNEPAIAACSGRCVQAVGDCLSPAKVNNHTCADTSRLCCE